MGNLVLRKGHNLTSKRLKRMLLEMGGRITPVGAIITRDGQKPSRTAMSVPHADIHITGEVEPFLIDDEIILIELISRQ